MRTESAYLLFTVGFVVLAAAAGAATVAAARRRRPSVLDAYLVFVAAWQLVGLITVLAVVLGPVLFTGPDTGRVILLMTVVGLPLWVLMLYAYTACCTMITGRTPGRTSGVVFAGTAILGLAGVLAQHSGLLRLTRTELPGIPVPVPSLVAAAVVVTGLARVVAHRPARPTAEHRAIRDFVWISATGWLVADLAKLLLPSPEAPLIGHLLTGVAYCAAPLPALWSLDRLAVVRARTTTHRQAGPPSPARLAAEWGITPRESEVVALVLEGRRNKEIQDTLCISLDTVKKHLFNVYRKTGVSSRVELLNLVRGLD